MVAVLDQALQAALAALVHQGKVARAAMAYSLALVQAAVLVVAVVRAQWALMALGITAVTAALV